MADFKKPLFEKNIRVVETLRPLTHRKNISPAQLAIAWRLQFDDVTVSLVGSKTERQLADNFGALSVNLSPEDLGGIDNVVNQWRVK